MPKVICELPNASHEINGIAFTELDDGRMISAEIDDETAAYFTSIPGYVLEGEEAPELPLTQPDGALTPQQKAAQTRAGKSAKEAAEKAAKEAADKEAADKAAAEQSGDTAGSTDNTDNDAL